MNSLRYYARASIKELIIRQFLALSQSQQQWIEASKGYQVLIKSKFRRAKARATEMMTNARLPFLVQSENNNQKFRTTP